MSKYDLKLLDCSLRDGGYINDWNWGYKVARQIIRLLVKARVDIVEVGFLRNVRTYNSDITVCNSIEELNRLLPSDKGNTIFSAMAMRSNYDISKLSPYNGDGIEMIRVTAHDYDIKEGMDFAKEVKDRGYKLSINPINIMGYSDKELLWLTEQVNNIHPYQFSIVDTFGSMKRRDLDRIVSIIDHNIDRDIRIALHLHENMALSTALAQNFIDKNLNRPISIDGSLMGVGRIPGNLPIELIADYLNDYVGTNYDLDYMMDAIQDYIEKLRGKSEWGYTPAYFLSARYNLHRNYAEHYLNKGDLTNRDINHILSYLDRSKATAFDKTYADRLYDEYKNNNVDDTDFIVDLKKRFNKENVLILAPGRSINTHRNKIIDYICENNTIVISVNFIIDDIKLDYAFFSNNKRYDKIDSFDCKVIVTSNLKDEKADYVINYNSLSGAFDQGCNSLVMLIKLLLDLNVNKICIAGADGYVEDGSNYYSNDIENTAMRDGEYNLCVANAIRKLGVKPVFITPSAYDINN